MKWLINFSILYTNRNFRLIYMGQLVSLMGTMITGVALPYQIYQETHSTLLIGLLSIVQLFPILITALLGGVLADRHNRVRVLVIAESLLSVGCLLLMWNATLKTPHVWMIFVASALMAMVTGFHQPALRSLTPQLVGKKDYPIVGALTNLLYSVGMIVGSALGGLVIAYLGLVTTFFIDFISFMFSLIALLMVRNVPKTIISQDSSKEMPTWRALIQGIHYAFSRQELVGSYIVDFLAMIFGMPMALFPAIAQLYGGPLSY